LKVVHRACGAEYLSIFHFQLRKVMHHFTDEQKAQIFVWIEQGASPADIQRNLKEEMGVSLTYLDTRLLADDLKLNFKEPELPPAPLAPPSADPSVPPVPPEPAASPAGGVSVSVDRITRPGALVSGTVVLSDGQKAQWFLDQTGRLGFHPETSGYRPSQEDILAFQTQLESLLRKQGF